MPKKRRARSCGLCHQRSCGVVVASEAHLGSFDRTRMAGTSTVRAAVAPPARLCLKSAHDAAPRATAHVPPAAPVPLKMGADGGGLSSPPRRSAATIVPGGPGPVLRLRTRSGVHGEGQPGSASHLVAALAAILCSPARRVRRRRDSAQSHARRCDTSASAWSRPRPGTTCKAPRRSRRARGRHPSRRHGRRLRPRRAVLPAIERPRRSEDGSTRARPTGGRRC